MMIKGEVRVILSSKTKPEHPETALERPETRTLKLSLFRGRSIPFQPSPQAVQEPHEYITDQILQRP